MKKDLVDRAIENFEDLYAEYCSTAAAIDEAYHPNRRLYLASILMVPPNVVSRVLLIFLIGSLTSLTFSRRAHLYRAAASKLWVGVGAWGLWAGQG